MAEASSSAKPTWIVRKGKLEDLEAVVDFNKRIASETEDLELNHDTITAGVRKILSNPESDLGNYFVAEVQEGEITKVVGCLMITYEWSDWRNAKIFWIQSVYVLSEYRRYGVFRSLFEHVHALAKAEGGALRLYVDRGNAVAQKVYTALGMGVSHYDLREIDFAFQR